eukprot:3139729-Prymnesium_polylepis.1
MQWRRSHPCACALASRACDHCTRVRSGAAATPSAGRRAASSFARRGRAGVEVSRMAAESSRGRTRK